MKILIIDRDDITIQLIKSKLTPLGHQVSEEVAKNNALERLANNNFDLIFIDPSPLTSARPLVLNIRRSVNNYPYIVLLSENASQEDAIKAGCNDVMLKPLDPDEIYKKIDNASRLTELVKRIGDDSEDFPSAGGVIAKSAFNQLFLSAIDRADRYGEQTYILFITVKNYQDILQMDGPYAADYSIAKLSQYLVRLRRQSDIIGQTAKYEYALLLQRPLYETEPVEAANRFAEALEKYEKIAGVNAAPIDITVSLIEVPIGRCVTEHVVTQS